jgi:hypothetical protein
MKAWVCRLQLLLVLASAVILKSEYRGAHDHNLLSETRDFSNFEGQVPVFITPRNRAAQLYTQELGSLFVASYDSQGYGGGIRPCLHTGSIVFLITILHGLRRKHRLNKVTILFVTAGTCIPIRCLETGCITTLFIRLLHSNGCCLVSFEVFA